MTKPRRIVRATTRFFEDLDRQLGQERGTDGLPSRNDFVMYELFNVIENFRDDFDALLLVIPGRPDYRMGMYVGRVVPRFSVVGQLSCNDKNMIELVELAIDFTPWPDSDVLADDILDDEADEE